MKSWKTTFCGVLALVGGGLTQFYPEYARLGGFLAFLGSGLGLLFARDNNLSSEDVGADPASKAVKDWAKSEPKPPAPSNIVGPPPVVGFLIAGLLAGVMLLGAGCRSIAPGGAYNGDKILFEADTTITTSYTLVDTFLKWEADNRVALSQWPDIKKYADKLRTDYPYWQRTAIALREAYAAAPSEAQGANLQRSLTLLRTALLEASGYMARAAAVK